jgi:hypothetical protein
MFGMAELSQSQGEHSGIVFEFYPSQIANNLHNPGKLLGATSNFVVFARGGIATSPPPVVSNPSNLHQLHIPSPSGTADCHCNWLLFNAGAKSPGCGKNINNFFFHVGASQQTFISDDS